MSDTASHNGERETLDDQELWEASSSSPDEWGESDDGKDWTVYIVGEEVRNQAVRHEVVWAGWQRPSDGARNTWKPEQAEMDTADWAESTAKRRQEIAKQSTDVQIWNDTSVVDTDTRLRSQAYDEKLLRSKRSRFNLATKMRDNLRRHGRDLTAERSDGESSPPPRLPSHRSRPVVANHSSGTVSSSHSQNRPSSSTGRGTATTRDRRTSATTRPRSGSSRLSTQPISSSTPLHLGQARESEEEDFVPKRAADRSSAPSSSTKGKQREDSRHEFEYSRPTSKGKEKACPIPQPNRIRSAVEKDTSQPTRKIAPLPVRVQGATHVNPDGRVDSGHIPRMVPLASNTTFPKREALSAKWTQEAKSKGAAPITFVNEVDCEEIPPLNGFCYLEKEYNYEEIEHSGRDPEGYFLYCDHKTCESMEHCSCQSSLENTGSYDNYGHFSGGDEDNISPFVVECNEYCACDERCRNRIAQLPRKVPIEIFKTRRCGWGARSSVDVEKGTILGLYTGKIIYRRDAELLKGGAKSFCFDMDGRENPDEEQPFEVPSYTVDARTCGNWTRFLNHSCAANVKVYSAVWWTVPESNLPCLVYYAAENIPARTELTVDYNPLQARLHNASKGKKKKGKGKTKIPEGAIPCECGTKACRGWVTEAP